MIQRLTQLEAVQDADNKRSKLYKKYGRFTGGRSGGYSIVEAMITLAIAGLMLTSVSVLLNGQKEETEFNQAMRDLDSKLQAIIGNVKAGSFTFPQQYKCTAEGSPPRAKLSLRTGTDLQGEGVNPACLNLGKAIQFVNGQPKAYIYTVLGIRSFNVGSETFTVTKFDETNPEPAIDTGFDLTETYTVASRGALFKHAGSSYTDTTGSSGQSDMAGFYYDLSNSAGGSNSNVQPLLSKVYNFQSDTGVNYQNGVQTCIRQDSSCDNAILSNWKLCFDSADFKQTAYIDITVTTEGINTKLNFINC